MAADTGGQQAAAAPTTCYGAHLDPRGAVSPAGQDPTSTLDTFGSAMLMGRLAAPNRGPSAGQAGPWALGVGT